MFMTVVAAEADEDEVLVAQVLLAAFATGVDTSERTPAPSAVTVASAIRLRSVFVDIYFLSVSQIKTFLIWLGKFR